MPNCSQVSGSRTARCAACDGKFGLVRYYSWRKPLCSKKCVERLAMRRQGERDWFGRFPSVVDMFSENRARRL